MRQLHFVLPNDIDDPATPSGGNAYDRKVCGGLRELGWSVCEHPAQGGWPQPTAAEQARLAMLLAGLPAKAVVMVDGLIGSAVPAVLLPEAGRLRLVMLVHLPLADDGERQALTACRAVLATSEWTRDQLRQRYGLATGRLHVAAPGVDAAAIAAGSPAGSRLLSVAAVSPHKGHDLLLDALSATADLPWHCRLVGRLDRDPDFVAGLRGQLIATGLDHRVRFTGPRTGPDLDAEYASSDLLVLASRVETYGMVVTEALARGIPVLATRVAGLPAALGQAPDGSLPGVLVPPHDPNALAGALRRWLTDPNRRGQLRRSAAARRRTLTDWSVTSRLVSQTLQAVAA